MEFWGVEIKSGETIVVDHNDGTVLHLSQACLGEVKKDKGSEPVYLFAKVDDQKFVLGILSSEKIPQISFDLVFEKNFELSHNWKNGSVYFTGYRTCISDESDESESEDDSVPIPIDHGKLQLFGKTEVKIQDTKKDDASSSDESSSDDDFGDGQLKNEEETSEDDDDESEDEDSEEEDEETPKKVDVGEKRSGESSKKTSGANKKAKFVTPETTGAKSGGKKASGHIATPYPSKQAGKTAVKIDQGKQQNTPKPVGAFPCKSCNRSFNSDNALQSHTKAKHTTAK